MCETLPMAALVLILSGTYASAWGLVRWHLSARAAMRHAAFAVIWLPVAIYGLFPATVGLEVVR